MFFSDRAHMEAHSFEAEEALSEGVKIKWLSSIRDIGAGALKVEIMVLDGAGVPQPTGTFETLQADSVILALGQQAESGFLAGIPGIVVKPDGNRRRRAGHDDGAIPASSPAATWCPSVRTVTTATGHGKKAARHIDG